METRIKTREEIDSKYKWNTSSLVISDEVWNQKFDDLMLSCNNIEKYKGTLANSAKNLLSCLEESDDISREVEKIYVYAQLKHHEDTKNDFYQAMANKSEALIVHLSSISSFLSPEIISIGEDVLKSFTEELEGLRVYRHYFGNLMRESKHILSPDKEKILAEVSELASAPDNIYSMLTNADMQFGNIFVDGKKIELTQSRFLSLMQSNNRMVRKNTFNTYYNSFIKQKNTLATVYSASVKKDIFFAKVRNYNSSLEASLSADNISKEIYLNLIDTVNKNLPLMHRYVELRKKSLGLKELHMYDLYAPIIKDADINISYEESKEKLIEALAPMGEDYIKTLKESFDNNWIDVHENSGKRSGAYSWGAYGVHPYVLLNFDNKVDDMFTLAHEMGHAMHSYYTWDTQPYVYGNYSIFLAEIASTVNESLLMDYLLNNTSDSVQYKYLLNYFMEQFRGTLFRQTMFAEFEMTAHEMAKNNEALTIESLNKLYRNLNIKYYGPSIVVDDKIDYEWSRIPHFYGAFYVYQYATGFSAAVALSKSILNDGEEAVSKYKDFLKGGSSKYPIEMLKDAGVDMTSSKPIEEALSVFESIMDKFEEGL